MRPPDGQCVVGSSRSRTGENRADAMRGPSPAARRGAPSTSHTIGATATPRARHQAPVKRRRGRRQRLVTTSWCRSATISRCSATRERTKNRSECGTEVTTDTMSRAYSEWPATSIVTRRTVVLVATTRKTAGEPRAAFAATARIAAGRTTVLKSRRPDVARMDLGCPDSQD